MGNRIWWETLPTTQDNHWWIHDGQIVLSYYLDEVELGERVFWHLNSAAGDEWLNGLCTCGDHESCPLCCTFEYAVTRHGGWDLDDSFVNMGCCLSFTPNNHAKGCINRINNKEVK